VIKLNDTSFHDTQPSAPSLSAFVPGLLDAAITQALQRQGTLTAVDLFSSRSEIPALETWYRELLPLQAPGPGEQYAFEVDLDRCSGCKACVTACHSLNGLDDGESFREVGLILDPLAMKGPQHITSACHHCQDPECSNGCPVLAYEKEADTGIVKHLDDQCIGCEYCVLKCPYDVPKYHHDKGIVRKCDMCVGRLRAGEAPACVQACPTKAIRITVVTVEIPDPKGPQGFALPGSPDPKWTRPTTRYLSKKALPDLAASADAGRLKVEQAHHPLVGMLVISQAAFGFTWAAMAWKYLFAPAADPLASAMAAWLLPLLGFGVMQGALLVSLAHLGRPHMAWKAWLNWRRSWLSREVIAFSAFSGLASLWVGVGLFGSGSPLLKALSRWPAMAAWAPPPLPAWMPMAVDALTALSAALALTASAMVYIDTPRALWRRAATWSRFFLTALTLGPCLVALTLLALGLDEGIAALLQVSALAQIVKMAVEFSLIRYRHANPSPEASGFRDLEMLKRSARLLLGPKRNLAWVRLAMGVVAAAGALVLSAGPVAANPITAGLCALLFLATVAADLLERHLFFATASAPRMPGAF